MGGVLLAENVERALDIFGPFVDDVEFGVGLDETAGGGANSSCVKFVISLVPYIYPTGERKLTSHVSDEEATVWLSTDFIND